MEDAKDKFATQAMAKDVVEGKSKQPVQSKESGLKLPKVRSEENMTVEELEMKYGAVHIIQVFVPVTICLLVVIVSVKTLPFYSTFDTPLPYTPFTEDVDDTTKRLVHSLGNALLFILSVIVATTILITLYLYRCYKVITWWIGLASVMALTLFNSVYLQQISTALEYPMDYLTAVFLSWNIGLVGMVAIHFKSSLRLQQAYLIYTSVIFALMIIKWMPQWTTWIALCFLIVWDLVAVLCPGGPLRLLVETAKERNEPIFTGMIYSSFVHLTVLNAESNNEKVESVAISSQSDVKPKAAKVNEKLAQVSVERQKSMLDSDSKPSGTLHSTSTAHGGSGVKLGLGDFVFYSVLIGNTSKSQDLQTTLACFVAILVGLGMTLILLAIFKKALPALPISLAFGLTFLVCTSIFVQPFIDRLTSDQIYI